MKDSLFLLSFDTEFQKGLTLRQAIGFAAQHGFPAVELYPVAELARPDEAKAAEIAKQCRDLGLDISCFSMSVDLVREDSRAQAARVKEYIDLAHRMGTGLFHHTISPSLAYDRRHTPTYREIRAMALEVCQELCEYAGRYGMTCVYEEQGFAVNGIQDFGNFYHSLQAENKGVVADEGNILFVGGDPAAFVAEFGKEVRHVHAKDYLFKGGRHYVGEGWYMSRDCDGLRGTVIGHGVIDHVKVFKLLHAAAYQGYCSIEFDGMEDPRQAVLMGRENMHYFMNEARNQVRNQVG